MKITQREKTKYREIFDLGAWFRELVANDRVRQGFDTDWITIKSMLYCYTFLFTNVSRSENDVMKSWVQENIKWYTFMNVSNVGTMAIGFIFEKDAMAFKLRWLE